MRLSSDIGNMRRTASPVDYRVPVTRKGRERKVTFPGATAIDANED
jgi:hypothetical protein